MGSPHHLAGARMSATRGRARTRQIGLRSDAPNMEEEGMEKVKMVCAHFGSDDVRADAYAEWNVEAQKWELTQTFEKGAYCSKCDRETRIEERPV